MTVDPSAVTAAEGTAAAAAAAAKGTVGKYRLDRVIGTGGMGIVWAAFDPDLERSVALKLLRVEATEPTMRTRLLREARAMAKLRHPNVVTVFDVGTDSGRDYIAMELVEGGTLDSWLETRPPRTEIVQALLGAGRGLAAAHTAGLVHRDFKPHNVLRAQDGHVYVTDFGLARGQIEEGPTPITVALPADEPISGSQPRRPRDFLDSTLTQTGVLIGTPAYMAPEQFGGGMPGPKSDQFAFCVTAWQALTGARPFRGSSIREIEEAARGGARELVADLPPRIRTVLERGLDPSPDARWPDMPSLLAAFAEACEERPARRAKRRWLVPALAASVGVASIAVVAVVALRHDKKASSDCVPAEEAFASVWSTERRAAFSRDMNAIGARIMLDDIKRKWSRSYTEACNAPRTAETHERIACLLEIRDDLARELASADPEEITGEVGAAMGSLATCDPTALRDWGFGPKGLKIPKLPKPPEHDRPDPPEPPEPP